MQLLLTISEAEFVSREEMPPHALFSAQGFSNSTSKNELFSSNNEIQVFLLFTLVEQQLQRTPSKVPQKPCENSPFSGLPIVLYTPERLFSTPCLKDPLSPKFPGQFPHLLWEVCQHLSGWRGSFRKTVYNNFHFFYLSFCSLPCYSFWGGEVKFVPKEHRPIWVWKEMTVHPPFKCS